VAAAEAAVARVVELTMVNEGWVCNPANHEDIPDPGECINCDGERHRTGYRVYQALAAANLLADPTAADAAAERARREALDEVERRIEALRTPLGPAGFKESIAIVRAVRTTAEPGAGEGA
jgi:hypothetical protein